MKEITACWLVILSIQLVVHGTSDQATQLQVARLNARVCKCKRFTTALDLVQQWMMSHKMVNLGPCTFNMGTDKINAVPGDGETPVRKVFIDTGFWIQTTEVSISDFAKFVTATGFTTTADILGSSYSFLQSPNHGNSAKNVNNFQWVELKNITWRNSTEAGDNHPAVHVSWDDAKAYCSWLGGDLPSEAEWEYACRGALDRCLFPWGNDLIIEGRHMTNIWQGRFPVYNSKEDGYIFSAPSKSFPPNNFGIYDMVGNVWEWVLDTPANFEAHVKLQKGGSFLCHRNHCYRYRCGARTKGSRDSTASNLGFRCVIRELPLSCSVVKRRTKIHSNCL